SAAPRGEVKPQAKTKSAALHLAREAVRPGRANGIRSAFLLGAERVIAIDTTRPALQRRRGFMAIAAQFGLDRRTVGFLQQLRRKYGDGPLALVATGRWRWSSQRNLNTRRFRNDLGSGLPIVSQGGHLFRSLLQFRFSC